MAQKSAIIRLFDERGHSSTNSNTSTCAKIELERIRHQILIKDPDFVIIHSNEKRSALFWVLVCDCAHTHSHNTQREKMREDKQYDKSVAKRCGRKGCESLRGMLVQVAAVQH